jgi:hypothetical protein
VWPVSGSVRTSIVARVSRPVSGATISAVNRLGSRSMWAALGTGEG